MKIKKGELKMKEIYYPSCNFNIASPQTARAIRQYLKTRMTIAGCCRLDHRTHDEQERAYIVCQACRENLQDKMNVQSLYEYLDQDPDFVFPDYAGQKMDLQDCYRDRNHPEVHQAIRSLLNKMNIAIIEMAQRQEKANFCGTLHSEAKSADLKKALEAYPDVKVSRLPEELQKALMQEQVSFYQCERVVCYCNRCKKGIELGGGHPIHILDLLFANPM